MSSTALPAPPGQLSGQPPGQFLGGLPPAQRFGLAFGAAVLAALAAATLLPPPAPPPPLRASEPLRPAEDRLTATLERAAAARPDDPAALRRLADHLRASHRPVQLAAVLERLHALTGEPATLREAMQLRDELGDAAAARAGLERLSAIGATMQAEALRLAALRMEAGDAAGAFAGLLAAVGRSPTPELALRAMQAAARLPDPAMAMRPLGALLVQVAPDLMEALRRVLMGDGRPDLALFLLEGLPAEDQAAPRAALALAEAEARAGWAGGALARLMALRATEGLPPGGGALLIDLALREGQVEEAFAVAALLPPDAWPPELPMRLHEAARASRDPALFRRIDPARLAARPDAAAVVALARGDRAAARRYAQQAVEQPPASVEGARGVAAVLRELGLDQAAHDRLRREVQAPEPAPLAVRLFAELAALPGRRAAALPLLERLRASGPIAGEAWLRLALAEDRLADVTRFLTGGGTASAAALAETLTLAAQRRAAPLADAAAAALRALPGLPEGWTAEEVAVTASLARPLGAAGLTGALNLLGWTGEVAAGDRVVRLLAAAPEVAGAAAFLGAAQHPAVPRLLRGAEAPGEAGTARLALVSVLAPAAAAPLLERRAETEPARFGPALVLARLRGEGAAEGEAALRDLLPRLDRAQREQALFLVLAAAPQDSQAALRRLAEATLGAGWQARYEAALTRQGRRAELLAALRTRAALADAAERQEIAARMIELGDPDGAGAVLRGDVEELR
ncbi:hypothetical protein HB662_04215 [Roseomonas frigidaquae]|uniref:HEAT repeat domain-containing protein n=1 Tax=Falsiroseomonas frigidaquae TaxID=487318 RepID=A0ABX1EW78_9PROT|nr:hypothetical protein [Falsiroseomonas frigidaquae]NKE43969.1 hypothetical protein [Falsiroseomonas frigidaquae]